MYIVYSIYVYKLGGGVWRGAEEGAPDGGQQKQTTNKTTQNKNK